MYHKSLGGEARSYGIREQLNATKYYQTGLQLRPTPQMNETWICGIKETLKYQLCILSLVLSAVQGGGTCCDPDHKYSSRCRHLCHKCKVEQNLPVGVVCRRNKYTNNLVGILPPASINNTQVTSHWLNYVCATTKRILFWLHRSADLQRASWILLRSQTRSRKNTCKRSTDQLLKTTHNLKEFSNDCNTDKDQCWKPCEDGKTSPFFTCKTPSWCFFCFDCAFNMSNAIFL